MKLSPTMKYQRHILVLWPRNIDDQQKEENVKMIYFHLRESLTCISYPLFVLLI